MEKIKFTILTKPSPGIMTKKINLVDDRLVKNSSPCWLGYGTAETIETTFRDLPTILDSVKTSQAIAWGVCQHPIIKIVTQSKEANTQGAISRTRRHFDFPKGLPGVMMLDNDTGLNTVDLVALIEKVMPELKGVAHIERASCSSGIYAGDKCLSAEGVGRVYMLVDDGSQIPRIGKTLHQRLILAGHGSVQITASGGMLVRSLVDDCVWQPERLDFVAPPVLDKRLERKAPKTKYIEGAALVTADVEDLSNEEQIRLDDIVCGLKAVKKPKADNVKNRYIDDEADKLVKATTVSKTDAVGIVRQRTAGSLVSGDILFFDDFGSVSVADVLNDPAKYDLATLADPLEPDYGGGRCKAIFYANDGCPNIHSFAHGSRVYKLGIPIDVELLEEPEKPLLTLPGGSARLNDCALALAKLLTATGRFYVHNGELCEVAA